MPRFRAHVPALLCTALLLLVLGIGAQTVAQVHIVHRHGVRSHLFKEAGDLGNETGGVLLDPTGYGQLEELGRNVRERYLADVSLTSAEQILSVSSDIQRTRGSAAGFIAGLVNMTGISPRTVPIYAPFGPPNQDRVIRAYANCPVLDDRQTRFFQSDALQQLERDTQWRKQLAERIGQSDTLRNWINVFDIYKLAVEYNENPRNLDVDSDANLTQMAELAGRIQSGKFARDVVGDLPGVALLSDIVSNMASAAHVVVEYSAHFPTLLSLAAALQVTLPDAQALPDFGAAIVFLAFKDGSVAVEYLAERSGSPARLQLPTCENATKCSRDEFVKSTLGKHASGVDGSEWCRLCGNTEMDICARRTSVSSAVWILLGAAIALGSLVVLYGLYYLLHRKAGARVLQPDHPW